MKVSIGEAAKELGVTPETLRRWEAQGKIEVDRTPKGHRRYDLSKLHAIISDRSGATEAVAVSRTTIAYARVSSHDQKEDLVRQAALLESYCAANGWPYELVQDLGSGLNYNKKGLRRLLRRISSGEVGRLVLTHQDRLVRFGAELVFALCEDFAVEVVILNRGETPLRCEEELAQDVLEIIAIFSARLYGSRSPKNRTLLAKLRTATQESV